MSNMDASPTPYHPVIEQEFQTSGPNIGRLNNTELAAEQAQHENNLRDRGFEGDTLHSETDRSLKLQLAHKAIDVPGDALSLREVLPWRIAAEAAGADDADIDGVVAKAKSEAAATVHSYDQLKKTAAQQNSASNPSPESPRTRRMATKVVDPSSGRVVKYGQMQPGNHPQGGRIVY